MTSPSPNDLSRFRKILLDWYDTDHRDLPWRQTKDPYKIWVSEIMLQQTTVKTVWHRWTQFLKIFLDVHSLADAKVEDVLAEWSGLGYYARARNLHKAATIISKEMNGKFPETFELLLALPGMGKYTAAAVASISFDYPVAVLDANVDRVLTRIEANKNNITQTKVKNALWHRAQDYLSKKRPGDWNQSMMELGATICFPKEPLCSSCPVKRFCKAYELGTPEMFPVKSAKAPMKEVREVAGKITIDGKTLLLHRINSGSFARMWELPRGVVNEEERSNDAIKRIVKELTGFKTKSSVPIHKIKHVVMRSKITLTIYECKITSHKMKAVKLNNKTHQDYEWVEHDQWTALPLSTTQKKVASLFTVNKKQLKDTESDFFDSKF